MSARPLDFAILALGVAAVSTAAVLVREAAAPVLVIAAYRLAFASLPLIGLAAARRSSLLPATRHDLSLTLLAGGFLALHFAFWIASVKQTSIVTSVVLVAAQPLFIGLASGPLLHERVNRATWYGIVVATAGALVMVAEDIGQGSDTLVGDLFAILGAVFAAAYILAGRSIRSRGAGWLPYVTGVDALAALILLILVCAVGKPLTGYQADTYVYFVLLALVPQLVGHTALIRSLGYLPAASVAIAILGEPVGATILGAAVLGETPSVVEGIGALLVLAGVYLGLRPAWQARSAPVAPA